MKLRTTILILTTLIGGGMLHAQEREHIDTLALQRAVMGEDVREYGGYLLDMGSILNREAPILPRFSLQIPDATQDLSFLYHASASNSQVKDYNRLFALPASQSYGTATWSTGYGFWNSGTTTLQSSTFQLKNGMRITTYGQYNKEGWRIPSHSALPWEQNMYKGAFELKSSNGAFGIRFEVERH